MQAHVAVLFRSLTVEIVDWRCAHRVGPFAEEEWNDAHEVVVVRRGAYVRRVEGEDVFLDAGTVAFGHPDETYRVRHPLPGGDACSAFRMPPAIAAALTRPGARADGEPRARFAAGSAPLDGRGYLLHRLAARAAADPRSLPLEVEELAFAFLQAAVSAVANHASPSPRCPRRFPRAMERVWAAREALTRRYRERLTLDDLARAAGCSPFHLSRLFRAATGVPLHRAQLRLRLRDALERLLSTADGLSAVAYATGFASHSHLTDAFRREYGCAPSAVRRLGTRAVARLEAPSRPL